MKYKVADNKTSCNYIHTEKTQGETFKAECQKIKTKPKPKEIHLWMKHSYVF